MIIGLIFLGLFALAGVDYGEVIKGEAEFPEWMWKVLFISPLDTYQTNIALIYNIKNFFGYEMPFIPHYINMWSTSLALILWATLPSFLSIKIFLKKDL